MLGLIKVKQEETSNGIDRGLARLSLICRIAHRRIVKIHDDGDGEEPPENVRGSKLIVNCKL